MAEAVLKDQRRVIPAIAYLEGEYGYSDIYLGVPTVLGGNGIEEIIELDLTDEEKSALDKSADSVKQDRKSTRLNSSHVAISYAVFCLKKKSNTGDERYTGLHDD